jgi:hypothetical protein
MENKNKKYCYLWTTEEDNFILRNTHRKDKEVAKELSKLSGRKISKDALRMRRVRLGVKKEEKYGRGTSRIRSVKINYQVLGKKRYRYNIFLG